MRRKKAHEDVSLPSLQQVLLTHHTKAPASSEDESGKKEENSLPEAETRGPATSEAMNGESGIEVASELRMEGFLFTGQTYSSSMFCFRG